MSNPTMKFIEMTGEQLQKIILENETIDLHAAGVDPQSIVRVNQHGDIEVRRENKWDVIGGLLGEFEQRVKSFTSLDWA